MKKILMAASLITTLLFVGCSNSANSNDTKVTQNTSSSPPIETGKEKTFTKEELEKYNGQDGNAAYIAVDGVVYDLSSVAAWEGGRHNGFEAGKDLSEEVNSSSNVKSIIESLPVVGKLTQDD